MNPNDLIQMKEKLKKVETIFRKPDLNKMNEVTKEREDKMRRQFFEGGVQYWYDIIEPLTFKSEFINFPIEAAKSLIELHKVYTTTDVIPISEISNFKELLELKQEIQKLLNTNKWEKFFIKLSTRSPKDSPIILKKATEDFKNYINSETELNLDFEDKYKLFSSFVQQNFCVSTVEDAFTYLITSTRVKEDIQYAIEDEKNWDNYNIKLIIREWTKPIPISCEFRCFVWKKQLNAIGQYYYTFYFQELQGKEEEIKDKLSKVYEETIKPRLPSCLEDCIIDFAIVDDKIIVIELNPFDGYSIGSFSGSTGLYLLDVPEDRTLIENGPLTIRILDKKKDERELKKSLDKKWLNSIKDYI